MLGNSQNPIGIPTFWQSIIKGLSVQGRVVGALVMREMITRYGRGSLGYLWALIEPLIMIAVFLLMFHALGRKSHAGMDLIPFLATGFVTFFAIRGTVGRLCSAISGNLGLLSYPHVTPLDTMIARAVLELATFIVVFAVIIFGAWLFDASPMPHDTFGVIIAITLAITWGFAFGIVEWGVELVFPLVEKFMSAIWRIMMFTSGIFFTLNDIPLEAQKYFALNPIFHAIEHLRAAFFPGYISPITSYDYLLGWIVGLLFLGLLFERSLRNRIYD